MVRLLMLAILTVTWLSPHAAAEGDAPCLLIEVAQVLRGPASDELERRRARIVEQLESARTPSAKRRIERALADLEERMTRSRSYVLDGWSAPARKDGTMATSTMTQRAVLLPWNNRVGAVLDDVEPGDLFLIDTESAQDLFTNEGRRYTRAKNIRRADMPDDWRSPAVRRPLPEDPDPDGAPGTGIAISGPGVSDHGGRPRYRYSVSIDTPANPGTGRVLQVWYHVYVKTKAGEVIGPLPTAGEYVDREGDGLSLHRSWEIIVLDGGPALSRDDARLEVVATRWSNRKSP